MKLFLPSLLIILSLIGPFSAAAAEVLPQKPGGGGDITLPDPFAGEGPDKGPSGILALLDRIATWIFAVFIGVAIILVLLAAFKYLTSGGSSEDVEKAHKHLIYAAVAVAVAVLAKSIVKIVQIITTNQ